MKTKTIYFLLILLICFGFSDPNEDIRSYLGVSVKSKEVKAFMKSTGTKHEIYKSEECYYYMFKPNGFDFMMSNSDEITTVFLFAEGADEHKQYTGNIPYALQFSHNRKQVEEILGPPEKSGGNGVIEFYSNWDSKGIAITYTTTDTTDMSNAIHHIALYAKK